MFLGPRSICPFMSVLLRGFDWTSATRRVPRRNSLALNGSMLSSIRMLVSILSISKSFSEMNHLDP